MLPVENSRNSRFIGPGRITINIAVGKTIIAPIFFICDNAAKLPLNLPFFDFESDPSLFFKPVFQRTKTLPSDSANGQT
jgi:hypothetical protein